MGSVFMGLIFRSIFSIGLLSAITGCVIVSYGPESVEPTPPSTKAGIAGFFFYTGAVGDPKAEKNSLPIEFKLIQEALENKGGFAAATVSNPASPKGIHLNIYETVIEQSTASSIFCSLSLLTLTAVPCYSSRGGFLVQYDLLVDSELRKTYRYEIREKASTMDRTPSDHVDKWVDGRLPSGFPRNDLPISSGCPSRRVSPITRVSLITGSIIHLRSDETSTLVPRQRSSYDRTSAPSMSNAKLGSSQSCVRKTCGDRKASGISPASFVYSKLPI